MISNVMCGKHRDSGPAENAYRCIYILLRKVRTLLEWAVELLSKKWKWKLRLAMKNHHRQSKHINHVSKA